MIYLGILEERVLLYDKRIIRKQGRTASHTSSDMNHILLLKHFQPDLTKREF